MPVIFKILVFLLLQQGARVTKDIARSGDAATDTCTIDISNILLARPMIFTVQSDDASVEELISLCTVADWPCEIRREPLNDGTLKAELVFKSLGYAEKYKMMTRILPLMNKIKYEWQEL